jgi:probable phosphoglycerate mutase
MSDELEAPEGFGSAETADHTLHHARDVHVVLVRHGQSQWNAEGRYQGQQGPGLTELGHQQARRVAAVLSEQFGPFHRAFASDLPRVQETLQPWCELSSIQPEIDIRWREIDAGRWSGRMPDDIKAAEPDEVAAFERGEDIPRGGGETFGQLRRRTWQAMTDIAQSDFEGLPPDQPARVVVFTHGGCIHMAAAQTLGLPAMGHRWLRGPANCSVSVFRHSVSQDRNGHGRALLSTTLLDYNVVPPREFSSDGQQPT